MCSHIWSYVIIPFSASLCTLRCSVTSVNDYLSTGEHALLMRIVNGNRVCDEKVWRIKGRLPGLYKFINWL